MIRPVVPLAIAACVATCQPQARRLLLLDLALSEPAALNGTARPWREAGYAVDYRRFYPHLTWQDVARYRTVVLLLGREPEGPSDALTAGDLALLNEWVARGGVVVLGYDADGEGYLDRWTANRWLESQGAGISIGDRTLEDTTVRAFTTGRAQPWAAARRLGDEPLGGLYDPFPLDRNHVVVTRDSRQLLAATSHYAFVRTPKGIDGRPDAGIAAAARLGEGLVVTISRYALAATGPQYRLSGMPLLPADALAGTREFLVALARWTRRPAEWAHVPDAGRGVPLTLQQAPLTVELLPPRLEPPAATTVVELPLVPERTLERPANTPAWLRQQGMRVLWMPVFVTRDGRRALRTSAGFDSLVALLDGGGFNLVAGDAAADWADSIRARWDERDAVRRAWGDAVKRLAPTSVAWIPVFDAGDVRLPLADSSRGPRGEGLPAPCVLDTAVWTGALGPAFGSALGRLAAEQRTLVIALGIDLGDPISEPRPHGRGYGALAYGMGQEFCDAAWRQALTRLTRRGELDTLPYAARYPALREAGLLPLYYRALEDLVAEHASAVRDRVLRQRRDVYFAVRAPQPPSDWFSVGVLRGLALPDRPLLLFTPEVRTRELLALLRGRGVNAVHGVELGPAVLRTRDLGGLRRIVFDENDGFWIAPEGDGSGVRPAGSRLAADSLARLVRRLAR